MQAGLALIACILVVQAVAFDRTVGQLFLVITLFLQGMGMGVVLPSLMNFALKSVPQILAGAASGVYSTFQQVASALGITLIGGLYFFIDEPHSGLINSLLAFRLSLGTEIGFLALLSLALSMLLGHQPISQPETSLVH